MAKVIIKPASNRHISGTYNWLLIAIVGAFVGLIVWGMSWLLGSFVIDPLLCRASTLQACGQSEVVAGNIAAIVGAIIGAIVLIRLHVRHSPWVVIAAILSFWGINTLISPLFWGEALVWLVVLYMLSYILFTWILRLRSTTTAVVVVIIVALLFRWIAFL